MIPFFRKRVRRTEKLPRRSIRPMLECLEQRLTPSTYTVTDAADTAGSSTDVTLRYAINQALANPSTHAVIDFSSTLAGKTITLSQTASTTTYGPTAFVVNNADITINGANAPGLVISGGNTLRPFAVQSSGSLTLENLTVIDGSAQGGAGGSGDYGGGGGGGAGLGGAIYDDGGNFTAEGVTFYGNVAQGGAGGAGGVIPPYSVIGGGGGGLGVAGQSSVNGGGGGGSGGGGGNSGVLPHTGGSGGFGGGGGGGGGGGYFGNNGNGYGAGGGGFGGGGGGGGSAYGGGAIGGLGGGLGGNGGSGGSGAGGAGGAGMGGALFVNGGTLTLTNDTFTGNTAQGGLGGSGSGSGGSGGSGSGGHGLGLGGSVFVRNGTMTATFDTFSSNTAQVGTDVYVLSDGSGNQATATLVDDILGQTANTVSDFVALNINSGTAPNLSGSSHDLVRNNGILPAGGIINGVNPLTPPSNIDGLPSSAVISSADPLLSPLANNGGPAQTMALSSNSPAFQQGITIGGITTDQRGYVRPTNAPSLGAYDPLATPPAPSPTPIPPPPAAPNEKVDLLFLAEDQFALTVDTLISQVTSNPTYTQAADDWLAYWNSRFGLDNPALGTGLAGLQSGIHDNPYYGTLWGQFAQAIGLDWAAAVLTPHQHV